MAASFMSNNATLSEVGRRLRDAAHGAGLTLRELGEKMEVSRPTIYAYASGALKMNEKRIAQVALLTGKSPGYFEPKTVADLDPKSHTIQSFRLIDALLAPPSPLKASEAARDALDSTRKGDTPEIRAELLRRLGNSLYQTGDFVGAVRNLEQALNTFLNNQDFVKQAACLQTLGVCYLSLGQVDRASDCFSQALETHPSDSKWKALIAIAALSERIGEFTSAEDQLSELLDDPALDEIALTYVRANYSSIVCTQGRWKSGLSQSETALKAAFAVGLTDQVLELLIQIATALTHLGRLEEATMMVVRARDVAFTLKDEARATLAEVAVARLLFAFGDDSGARTAVGHAYSRALKGQYRRSESQSLLLLAELAYARADDLATQELAQQLRSHAQAHQFAVTDTIASILEAKALTRLNKLADADRLLTSVAEQMERIGDGRPRILLLEARALWNQMAGNHTVASEGFGQSAMIAEKQELLADTIRILSSLQSLNSLNEGVNEPIEIEFQVARLTQRAEELCPNPQVWKRFLGGWPQEGAGSIAKAGMKS